MVMASGTTGGKTQKSFAESVRSIGNIFHLKLLLYDATFHVLGMISIKSGGNNHFLAWIGKYISSQLPLGELIEGHIPVESGNNPISVRRHFPQAIDSVAMGIGEPGNI